MTLLLVGHRGVGKTTFLRSLEHYASNHHLPLTTHDLDQAIEKNSGRTLVQWFKEGEAAFRAVEGDMLHELCDNAQGPTVIAVGAGYSASLPNGVRTLWLRRQTDQAGRSFLNRPRLNAQVSPLQEYLQLLPTREARYAAWADEQLILPEGYQSGLEEFAFHPQWHLPWECTLLPENFRDWDYFWQRRAQWGVHHWEIRTDLLSQNQIASAMASIPADQLLYSQRNAKGKIPEEVALDWAVELGAPPKTAYSLSLHEREEDFSATVGRLENLAPQTAILKLAVEIKNFNELRLGHEWWLRNPTQRSFLPRSTNGRWRWYRSFFGPRMPLHFFRENSGSALDQPLLNQALLQPPMHDRFAAVLGSPIEHSRSPLEHLEFFKQRNIPIVAIDVTDQEFAQALPVLRALGLRYAAVTAPLKKAAFAGASKLSPTARETQSANTLYIDETSCVAHNTDVLALAQLHRQLPPPSSVWLWGGGGVQSSVKAVWPEAQTISARRGSELTASPQLLIWATGRSRPFVWPQKNIRPQLVLDLNYSEDSPGLEWAVRENLPYQSGLTMFKLQAELQREFWREQEGGQ